MRKELLTTTIALASACTSFSTVRSAEVSPGPSMTLQASISSPPADEAGWFWSMDCDIQCTSPVGGVDLSWAHAFNTGGGKGSTLGLGTSGFYPFVEYYTQLSSSRRRPFGIGARVGIPAIGWGEHRVYGRFDFVGKDTTQRFLWNPGIMITAGNSPNGANPGGFVGLVNGLGVQFGQGNVVWTPSLSSVVGRAVRHSYGRQLGPTFTAFTTAGLSVSFRRKK